LHKMKQNITKDPCKDFTLQSMSIIVIKITKDSCMEENWPFTFYIHGLHFKILDRWIYLQKEIIYKRILVREVSIYIYIDGPHFKMLDRDRYIYKKVIT